MRASSLPAPRGCPIRIGAQQLASRTRAVLFAAMLGLTSKNAPPRRHLPLYSLRWVLIVLNPLRPERRASPQTAASREALLADRLGAAIAVMDEAVVWVPR